jgi:hypothetical protein
LGIYLEDKGNKTLNIRRDRIYSTVRGYQDAKKHLLVSVSGAIEESFFSSQVFIIHVKLFAHLRTFA